jgi:hypothetical protein
VWLCNQQYTPVTRHIFVLDPPFVPQETLRAWQNKNHPWLELSDVHKETTENIRVTVIPFYMGFRESHSTSVYWVGAPLPPNFFSNTLLPVEILHKIRKFRFFKRAVARTPLEDFFPVRYSRNRQGQRSSGTGTGPHPDASRVPVQQSRESAST